MKVAGGGPSVHACAVFLGAESRDGDNINHTLKPVGLKLSQQATMVWGGRLCRTYTIAVETCSLYVGRVCTYRTYCCTSYLNQPQINEIDRSTARRCLA